MVKVEEVAMKMSKHMTVCLALVGIGVIAVAGGIGGTWLLLPLVGCMLMMGWMMWMMGMGGGGDRK